ncbi:hypothetical protein LXA43DRAFT_643177 [Ganoderma leucocontextum]|nr:hypothetical protein LXA43DRAFT_643177 [Ganoderma leucocontextum]
MSTGVQHYYSCLVHHRAHIGPCSSPRQYRHAPALLHGHSLIALLPHVRLLGPLADLSGYGLLRHSQSRDPPSLHGYFLDSEEKGARRLPGLRRCRTPPGFLHSTKDKAGNYNLQRVQYYCQSFMQHLGSSRRGASPRSPAILQARISTASTACRPQLDGCYESIHSVWSPSPPMARNMSTRSPLFMSGCSRRAAESVRLPQTFSS